MNANSMISLRSIQATINLENGAVAFKNNPNIQAWLKPSSHNDRIRTQSSKLGYAFEFDLKPRASSKKLMGEYGFLWAKKTHGNKHTLPSIKEIFMGLYNFKTINVNGLQVQDSDLIDMFDFLLEVIEHEDFTQPLT